MRRRGRTLVIAAMLAFVAYLATGITVVSPGEVVVVRRLGRVLDRPWGPGLHWGLPAPLDVRDRLRTEEVRRVEVGLVGVPGPTDDPGSGEFLTGDRNLLNARAVVQYRVADPLAFRLGVGDIEALSGVGEGTQATGAGEVGVERLLTRLAESSLARALAGRSIDEALRNGRAAVAREAQVELARQVDQLGLGVAILGVSLTDTRPPVAVAPAFDEAQAARSARDRRRQDAFTYEATTAAAARAEADARLERAHAVANRTIAMGRAGRIGSTRCSPR